MEFDSLNRMIWRRVRRLLALAACLLLTAAPAFADPLLDVVQQGWTKSDLENVPAIIKDEVTDALERPSMVRHFPQELFRSEMTTEAWLAEHPPIAAAVGRELGLIDFRLVESWPNIYEVEGGPLELGQIHVLLREETRTVIYVTGRVDTLIRRNMRVNAVVCARWWPAGDGKHIHHDIFVYTRIRSRSARALAWFTRPLSGPWVTRRLRWLVEASEEIAESVSARPEAWAKRMAEHPDRGTADALAWQQLIDARQRRPS